MLYSFIRNIKTKIQDMKTISKLCLGAEKYAHLDGEEKPGAEHFMLASLDLPDGTVKNIFKQLNINPNEISQAIKNQHSEALSSIGINQETIKIDLETPEVVKSSLKLYDTKPSGQTVMQKIYKNNKNRNTPLIGAHVIEVIVSMEYGIAIRALQTMGVNLAALKKAVEAKCNYV